MSISKRLIVAYIVLMTLLASAVVPAGVRAPGDSTTVSISPSTVGPVDVGSLFDIIVHVDNVKGMVAYSGILSYDTLVLTATVADAEYSSPTGGVCASGCEDITSEGINEGLGQVSWEVAMTGFAEGFTGSGGMVKITFRVDTIGISQLTPVTTLLDTQLLDIPHTDSPGSVFPAKTLPVAVLLPDLAVGIDVDQKISFDGSQSMDLNNPPQQIIRYTFTVDGVVAQSSALSSFSFSNGIPGRYSVCLVVENGSGLASLEDCTIVTVNAIKNPPTAVLLPEGPLNISLNEKVVFDGLRSYDNSSPPQQVQHCFFSINGTVISAGPCSGYSIGFTAVANYNVCMYVTNTSGYRSAEDCTVAKVSGYVPPPVPPTSVLLPEGPIYKQIKTEAVMFDGSQSYDSNSPPQVIIDYTFSVNGGTAQSGPSQSFVFGSLTPGNYTVCLIVTNQLGLQSSPDCSDVTLTVAKLFPTAVLRGSPLLFVGETGTYNGSLSFDNNKGPQPIVSYVFSINGTMAQSGPGPTFAFTPIFTGYQPVSYAVCLVVTNESGLSSTPDCIVVIVFVEGVRPTAVLLPDGPLKIDVNEKVLFDGSHSVDSNNPPRRIVRYVFTVNGAIVQNGPDAFFSFTTGAPGTYIVCLVVINESKLGSAPDCTDITINVGVKEAPTAVLNPPGPIKKQIKPEAVVFDGNQSYDNNSPPQPITAYTFRVNGFIAQAGPSSSFVFGSPAPGLYVVCLVVTNTSGLQSTSDCSEVTLSGAKYLPTAVLTGPANVTALETATYDGSLSFDSNKGPQPIVRYEFSVNNTVFQAGASTIFYFTPSIVGSYAICLVVVNESGLPSQPSCNTVTVNSVKREPTAIIDGPIKVTEGDSATYDGSLSHDNSIPPQTLTFTWFNKATGEVLGNGATLKILFTIPKGTFDLSLTVCNTSNLCDTDNFLITVNPLPFVADVVMPVAAYATEPATFTVSVSGGSPPYTCTIDFGDGSFPLATPCANGQVITHTYAATGIYTVTFRATGANPGEDSGTITRTVSVQPEPLFLGTKLSWKHHLTTVTQTFSAKATNPSKYTVVITVIADITKPDGTRELVTETFTLGPGATSTFLPFTYNTDTVGKYCFTATLQYQVDGNGDGVIDITGTGPNTKSGCFNRV